MTEGNWYIVLIPSAGAMVLWTKTLKRLANAILTDAYINWGWGREANI